MNDWEYECGNSYHLKSNELQDSIALLKRANLKGYVFPAQDGWITILTEITQSIDSLNLMDFNKGILVHYIGKDDLIEPFWCIYVYKDNEEVFSYETLLIEEDPEVDDIEQHEVDKLYNILMTGDENGDEKLKIALQEFFFPDNEDELFEIDRAYDFARIVGLNYSSWLCYDYALRREREGNPLKNAIFIE